MTESEEAEKYMDKETTISYQDQEHFNSVIEADMKIMTEPKTFKLSNGFEHTKEEDAIMHALEKMIDMFALAIYKNATYMSSHRDAVPECKHCGALSWSKGLEHKEECVWEKAEDWLEQRGIDGDI